MSPEIQSVQGALRIAESRAADILNAPIWDHNDEAHYNALLRSLDHGRPEALIGGIYIKKHGLPVGVRYDTNLSDIMLAFLVHDFGKVESAAIDSWNLPRDQISESEWKGMGLHVKFGYDILDRYEKWTGRALPSVTFDVLLYHHEKLDGSGSFPIYGRDLCFFGRLAVCIDQIVSRCEFRPYHEKKYTLRSAVEEVQAAGGGLLYDKDIVDRLASIFSHDTHLQVDGLGWLGSWQDG